MHGLAQTLVRLACRATTTFALVPVLAFTQAPLYNVTVFSDGTEGTARVFEPRALVRDTDGAIILAQGGRSIRKLTLEGVLSSTNLTFPASDGVYGNFLSPSGIASDSAGNKYIVDIASNLIWKISPTNVATVLAGQPMPGYAGGSGVSAKFSRPNGIALSPDGSTVYVSDEGNHVIRKIDPNGVVSVLAGSPMVSGAVDGIGAEARFYGPGPMCIDKAGVLFVYDMANYTLRKVTPDGVVTTLAGKVGIWGTEDGIGAAARFTGLGGLTSDNDGNIYVTEVTGNTIRKITPLGAVTTLAGGEWGSWDGLGTNAAFAYPYGISLDVNGDLVVADYGNHLIRKVSSAGEVSTIVGVVGRGGSVDGSGIAYPLSYGLSVAVDRLGNVYFSDGRYIVQKMDIDGILTTIAGQAYNPGYRDGPSSESLLGVPADLAVDAAGNVYVADVTNYVIRKISPNGIVSTLAGMPKQRGWIDGVGMNAAFTTPNALAVDASGNIYVADLEPSFVATRIRKITPEGRVSTLAGNLNPIDDVDGMGAAAHLTYIRDLAFGPDGNLYGCDWVSASVRKITPDGNVTTVFKRADSVLEPAREALGIAVDRAGNIILSGNFDLVSEIPGIGGKTAEKILAAARGEEHPAEGATDEGGEGEGAA